MCLESFFSSVLTLASISVKAALFDKCSFSLAVLFFSASITFEVRDSIIIQNIYMVHLNSGMVEHLLPGVVKLPLPRVVSKPLLCQADRFLKELKMNYLEKAQFQLFISRYFCHLSGCVDTSCSLELNCSLLTVSLSFHCQLQGLIVRASLLNVRSNSLGQGLREKKVKSGGTEALSTFR